MVTYLHPVKEAISTEIIYHFSGLYKILSLGREETNPVITNATMKSNDLVYFVPRHLLHLSLKDEISNFSCITAVQIHDLVGEGNP